MSLPLVMILKIDGERRFVIPIPLILLWPLLPVLFAFIGVVGLIVFRRGTWLVLRLGFACLTSLSELQVDVRHAGGAVRLRFV